MSARRATKVLGGVALGLVALALTAAAEPVSIRMPQPYETPLKPGPGRLATEINCVYCHSLDYIPMQPPNSAAQWNGIVTKMMKVYGATLNEEEVRAIVEYLATNYGPAK